MFDDASALDSALEEICSDGPSDETSEDMDLLGGTRLLFNCGFATDYFRLCKPEAFEIFFSKTHLLLFVGSSY